MLFDTCFCVSPAQPGLPAVEVPVVIPRLAGLCSARPQASADSKEEFWSGPRAQQLHWGKTWLPHPN